MVKFILGEKGSGKTKWLIDNANKDMQEGNGNIAFIDVDHNHIFSLSHNVRLINATEFNITSIESFYGFLCGTIGMDYDLEKIYVDSIYKVINLDITSLEVILENLTMISDKFETDFFINIDYTMDQVPDSLKEYCVEIPAEYV